QLDADVAALDGLRAEVAAADEAVAALRVTTDGLEASLKDARVVLDAARAGVSELDVVRATAEGDLSHLAHTCEDAVNATLEAVLAEVEQIEASGRAVPEPAAIDALDEGDEAAEDAEP